VATLVGVTHPLVASRCRITHGPSARPCHQLYSNHVIPPPAARKPQALWTSIYRRQPVPSGPHRICESVGQVLQREFLPRRDACPPAEAILLFIARMNRPCEAELRRICLGQQTSIRRPGCPEPQGPLVLLLVLL